MLSQSGSAGTGVQMCSGREGDFRSLGSESSQCEGDVEQSFPQYDDLSTVFGKDRAVGQSSENPYVMGTNAFREFEDEIRLGSQDCHIPEVCQTESTIKSR
ncbi:uncharacterized protein LOC120069600 [Benincasa hispida]|uniref:uncharacterized protein LOC120069600 n=1 Tax=Benincasa hispida TaxID=102211 RepID=UPI00190003CA|nr:uncharacterized protein LOC120069600 [Benincasa hispida]